MEPTSAVIQGLLAAAPDALIAVDQDGSIVYVNDQAEFLFGWSRDELIGSPVEQLVPERFVGNHPALRSGYVRNPASRPMGAGLELSGLRKDGSEFPAEISLSSFETEAGPLMAAAIRDVTVARRTEQRFKAVLASAPDAIIGVKADGRIELVNAQAERLFGWSAEDLIGQKVEVLVPVRIHHLHQSYRAGYVANPQVRPMGAGLALAGRRKDGSEFPAEISLSAVFDYESRLVLAAIRDTTDRMELEKERRALFLEAQREQSHRLESLGQLAGGVAHDFNNLLGVILNYSTLIERNVEDPVVVRDLGEIREAATRGAALTRQLLTFARRDVVNPEPVDVVSIIKGVASMLDRTLGEQVTLNLELTDVSLVVVADRHQLEQILLNLAINARDAMPSGGVLAIAAGREGPNVILKVTDTGGGMPPDVVARAFEPFFTTKSKGGGTGLGLATVYGIVQRSNGEVRLDSVVGQGTAITILLPASTGEGSTSDRTVVTSTGGHERILLVEDEEALRIGTARLLRAFGYEVVVAVDGLDAVEAIEREGAVFDLVLTDVAMPRMRGDELVRWLDEHGHDVPRILMSGYDSSGTPIEGPTLQKPVDQEALLRTMREVLDG